MHTVKLHIDDSIYTRFLSFINQFQNHELAVLEDNSQEDFIVSSKEEVQSRIFKAESNAFYQSSNDFWSDIDRKTESL
jgi:hypothetical protein